MQLPFFNKERSGGTPDSGSAVFRTVWEDVVEGPLRYTEIDPLLRAHCQCLIRLPGVLGALIAITDGHGEWVGHQGRGLGFFTAEDRFEEMRTVRELLKAESGTSWTRVEGRGPNLYSHRLSLHGTDYGLVLVEIELLREELLETFETLDRLVPQLALQARTELTRRESDLRRKLQELSVSGLDVEIPSTDAIVRELQGIIGAASVTLLIKEYERVYLSATTEELGSRGDQVLENEGISRWVLRTGEAVCLFDSADPREAPEDTRLGGVGEGAEKVDFVNQDDPSHILVLPASVGGSTSPPAPGGDYSGLTAPYNGVLRLSRKIGPFTDYEKKALAQFANSLGTAIARAWRIFLANRIWKDGKEAIAITRYEPPGGREPEGWPRLVAFDEEAASLFDRHASTLDGFNARDLYPKKKYKQVRKTIRAALETKERALSLEGVKIVQPGGRIRSASASYRLITSPFARKGARYTISILRDTTDQDKALAQHQRLIELLTTKQLAYFAADEEGRTLETSPAESELTGYSQSELETMNRVRLYSDRSQREPLMQRVVRSRGTTMHIVQELCHRNGSSFQADGFIRTREDDWGEGLVFEGLYEDATDKIRLQELLQIPTDRVRTDKELFERIREATNLNLDYMTSLSHQLRTPLSALIQNLYDFKRRLADEDAFSKEMDYLIGQTRVANMLVSNLSFIDRILKGEDFNRRELKLAEMAVQTKLNFRHIARDERDLTIVVDDQEIQRVFGTFVGNNELFRQVLVNLTDNAFKYAAPGSEIRITASRGRYDRRFLDISDTGIPIPKGRTKEVFERGYRDPVAAATTDGTGMGLWIARKITELHGGTISCTSDSIPKSRWARVTFRLEFPPSPVRERREELE